jgi:hypothetical protein
MHLRFACASLLGLAALNACADAPSAPSARPDAPARSLSAGAGAAYTGPQTDYQPSLLREPDGSLTMVVERLGAGNSGDLLITRSVNGGATWTVPSPIIASSLNERHPALVRLASGGYALFFMVDEGRGRYRIHRATSPDGNAWIRHGALALGWKQPGEINPAVIVEGDGSLTMTYHLYQGAAYIARSTNGGATWDALRTSVSGGATAALPRIAKRASDGRYVVTYQVNPGDGNLDIYAKVSANPYDWSAAPTAVSVGDNSHDAQPIVLPDGRFYLVHAAVMGAQNFNLFARTSADGIAWSAPAQLTTDAALADVEPHPIPGATPGTVVLAWGRQATAGTNDYDIWVDPAVSVP